MAKYYSQKGIPTRAKILKRLKPLVLLLFMAILGLLGWFVYDFLSQNKASEADSKATKPISSAIVSTIQTHTTPYFQLKTPVKWRAVPAETRDGHYVFRQFNSNLVEQDLIIDVNNSAQEVLATTRISRALVVSASDDGSLNVLHENMEHCQKAVPKDSKKQQLVTMNKATFPCNPTATEYKVVVALSGGTNIMNLKRPNGTTASYKITFRNLMANANSRDIVDIIETFETR